MAVTADQSRAKRGPRGPANEGQWAKDQTDPWLARQINCMQQQQPGPRPWPDRPQVIRQGRVTGRVDERGQAVKGEKNKTPKEKKKRLSNGAESRR